MDLDSDFSLRPIRLSLPQDEVVPIPDFVVDESAAFRLYVSDRVLVGIRQYATHGLPHEVGGVLFGRRYQTGERHVVFVTEHVPLPSDSRSATHFTFDERALTALHQLKRAREDDYIVGWFHSHPRLGDPFMSRDDLRVHRDNFKRVWNVSCVVASGEWAMPVGFWRMDGDRLLRISEYFVQFTSTKDIGDQARRFLEVCVNEKRPLSALLARADSVMSEFGVPAHGAVRRILRRFADEDTEREVVTSSMAPVGTLLDVAGLLRRGAVDQGELDECRKYLDIVTFLEDAVTLAIATPALKSKGTVAADRSFGFDPGGNEIVCFDFAENRFWPIRLEPVRPLIDIDCASASSLWILAAPDIAICLPTLVTHDYRREVDGPPTRLVRLGALDSEPLEIAVDDDTLWVRTETRLRRIWFAVGAGREVVDVKHLEDVPLPALRSVLIKRHDKREPLLLSLVDGSVVAWSANGEKFGEAPLPPGWRDWRPVEACAGIGRIYFLLDSGDGNRLVALDSRSLEVRAWYTQDRAPNDQLVVHSLAKDPERRVYVRVGDVLYLLAETGGPSPKWYHYQERRDRPRERAGGST